MPETDDSLLEAERISAILSSREVPVLVIGAVALAAHGYVRATFDIDLGVNVAIRDLKILEMHLRSAGFVTALHEPDGDDPLGGVIDVTSPSGLIQIVNFGDRFPAVIQDALEGEKIQARPDLALRVIPLPQLVVLKLYAGGVKSLADIIELLRRNPEADLQNIETLCRKYRLRGWNRVLAELEQLG
jgi:hypothetical protein